MALAFLTTNEMTSHRAPGGRLLALGPRRAIDFVLAVVQRWKFRRTRLVVSPVSEQWLMEYEGRSRKHEGDR
jgi:hypothetical protein